MTIGVPNFTCVICKVYKFVVYCLSTIFVSGTCHNLNMISSLCKHKLPLWRTFVSIGFGKQQQHMLGVIRLPCFIPSYRNVAGLLAIFLVHSSECTGSLLSTKASCETWMPRSKVAHSHSKSVSLVVETLVDWWHVSCRYKCFFTVGASVSVGVEGSSNSNNAEPNLLESMTVLTTLLGNYPQLNPIRCCSYYHQRENLLLGCKVWSVQLKCKDLSLETPAALGVIA